MVLISACTPAPPQLSEPAMVNAQIYRSKGEKDYWQIYPYLPKETRGYVPAFIAANYIMNYYCDHNICPMRAELPAKTDTVVVNRDIHFEQIAKVLNMDVNQIKQLNHADVAFVYLLFFFIKQA